MLLSNYLLSIFLWRTSTKPNSVLVYFLYITLLTTIGACGTCPSSTTTMKMGIERILKENFVNLGSILAVSADDLKNEISAATATSSSSSQSIDTSSESKLTDMATNTNTMDKVEEIIENLQNSIKAATNVLTIEKVSESLENIMKAIKGLGGKIEILSVNENGNIGQVKLKFQGSMRLKKGIELVLKDIPSVTSIVFEEYN